MIVLLALGCVLAVGSSFALTVPRIDPASYVARPEPQAVLMTFADGPTTRGFAWQTDDTVREGELRLIEGACSDDAFDGPGVTTVRATSTDKSEGPVKIICHKAQVSGLVPGQEYSYRLGAKGHYAYGSFVVKGAKTGSADPVTIVCFSDAQPRSADKVVVWENTVSNAAAQVARLGRSPDLVLSGGDLFDVNWFYSQDAHAKDANYWFSHPIYGKFGEGTNEAGKYKYNYWKWGLDIDVATPYFPGVPWALARGNHDFEGADGARGGVANGDVYYDHVTAVNWKDKCHSFDYGNVHVLVLPCLSRGDNAGLYADVAAWADDDLSSARNAAKTDWTVVEMHWGPYTTGDHGLNADGIVTRFAPIFSKHHVDLVMQAHDHTFSKTLPYRWDHATACYTSATVDKAVVNTEVKTESVCGETFDVDPHGTYYVIGGCSGHRVGEDGTTYTGATGAKSYTTRPHKVAVGTITTDSPYARKGAAASQNPNASMFSVLRVDGDRLACDFYAVATDGLSAPVLFDTLRVKKTLPLTARSFCITPYVQHPATNAMSLVWFTKEPGTARVTWRKEGEAEPIGSALTSGDRAEALTNNVAAGEAKSTSFKYRHRVRLTNLETGTHYRYEVELANGVAYSNVFRTAPGKESSVRFIYYNDSETEPNDNPTTDWTDPANNKDRTYFIGQNTGYASNIVHMVRRRPDLFVVAGDLAGKGGKQRDWDEFWRHNAGGNGVGYNDPGGSIPILAAVGNHDLQDAIPKPTSVKIPSGQSCENYAGGELALPRYLAYFEYEPNGVRYEIGDGETFVGNNKDRSQLFHRLDYGPVTLIFLDTNNGDDSDSERDTNTGLFRDPAQAAKWGLPPGRSPDFNPGSKQYAWLTNNLADAQAKSKFTFVVNHHCPYSVGYHNRTNIVEGGEWLSARAVRILGEAMVRYGVDGWLCGHDEMVEHSQIHGMETLPDGTMREKTVDIFDMGTAGDGLRGRQMTKEYNPREVWRAHKDAPEVWEDGALVSGGKHYGHMEINVHADAEGRWVCEMTPVYIFVSKGRDGKPCKFERRTYDDVVILYSDGGKDVPPASDGGTVFVR